MVAKIKAVFSVLITFAGIFYTTRLLKKYFKKTKLVKYFHEVLFFPDLGLINSESSKDMKLRREIEIFSDVKLTPSISHSIMARSSSLLYLVKFLLSAKSSLDMCLLIFTLSDLKDAILEAKRKGVRIRIIIDKTMADCDASCIPSLQFHDVLVVRGPSSAMIHNKFAVADGKSVPGQSTVVTGSLNWTWGAVTSNYENLIITNYPEVVSSYQLEFDRLWSKFYITTDMAN